MAITKRTRDGQAAPLPAAEGAQTRSRATSADYSAYALPSAMSEPSTNLFDFSWLIYGTKGIGKTSLAAEMGFRPNAKVLLAPFEPGGKALKMFRLPVITDWGQIKNVVSQLEQDKAGYTTIVIDPANMAYQKCLEYTCKNIGIVHPGMMKDYGASWNKVAVEFQELHARIAAIDLGFIAIAHDKENEYELRDGTKIHRTEPVMTGSTEEFYTGVIDIVAHYHYIGDDRFLRIRGCENVIAKCRIVNHFKTPAGADVVRIPMGQSAAEGYANILNAFENKQNTAYTDAEVYGHGTNSDRQIVKKLARSK